MSFIVAAVAQREKYIGYEMVMKGVVEQSGMTNGDRVAERGQKGHKAKLLLPPWAGK